MSQVPIALLMRLCKARSVAVLTGAGISAESGVPTFRDDMTGLWARFRPEDLATREAFRRNPKLVWDWYQWRRGLIEKARPNAGHEALARLEDRFADFTLITQNVDDLHRKAGSRNVLELHGNIRHNKCFEDNGPVDDRAAEGEAPPRCPRCGGRVRPDVVWFGEYLPQAELAAAFEASRRCEVFLCVGTSALVHPAASLPVEALKHDACLVEINPVETPLSPLCEFSLRGPAASMLPGLLAQT